MLLEDLITDYDSELGVDAAGLAAVLRDRVPGIDLAISGIRRKKDYAVIIGKDDGGWIYSSVFECAPKRAAAAFARNSKRKPCSVDVVVRNDLDYCVGNICFGADKYRLLIVPDDIDDEFETLDEMYDDLCSRCNGRWGSNYSIQCV